MSRNSRRSLACWPETIPSSVSCLAMNVMARVFTTPYRSHTTSHAQWRFHKFVWRSTNAHPSRTCWRSGSRASGAVKLRIGDLLLFVFVFLDAPAGEDHEDVVHVDRLDGAPVSDKSLELERRSLGDDLTADEERD